MTTTFAVTIAALEALTISGVARRFTAGPPVVVHSGDLPAQWCDLPRGEERPLCAGVGGRDRTMSVDLVVALQAVGQDLRVNNWPAVVTMMDSIAGALRTWDETSALLGPATWRSRLDIVQIGGTALWAVVTEISALG